MLIIGVILYMFNGHLVLDKIPVKDLTECRLVVGKRVEALQADPRFNEGIWAGCIAERANKS